MIPQSHPRYLHHSRFQNSDNSHIPVHINSTLTHHYDPPSQHHCRYTKLFISFVRPFDHSGSSWGCRHLPRSYCTPKQVQRSRLYERTRSSEKVWCTITTIDVKRCTSLYIKTHINVWSLDWVYDIRTCMYDIAHSLQLSYTIVL